MRDLQIGFDAVDVFGPDQIERAVLRASSRAGEIGAGERQFAGIQPAPGDLGAGDRRAAGVDQPPPLAFSTMFSVIGRRGEASSSPAGAVRVSR